MVGSYLMGGLGNQLFQYAAGRALSLRRGVPLCLDLSWFEEPERLPYELDLLGIDPPPALDVRWRVHEAEGYVFDPRVLDAPDGSKLVGYWQSERYFEDAADWIRSDISLPGDRFTKTISLHVRRGTAKFPADPTLGLMTVDYYREAVAEIARRSDVKDVMVFADDWEWVRDNLKLDLPWVGANGSGLADFSRMSRCEHHVIANSSFSWWAAWLNPSPDKIVVGPTDFAEFRTPDFLPVSWTGIPCAP
jgi:hypothetical protein